MYPVAILSVLPVALFEQRYCMASVMFFLLFAEWKTVHVDRLTLAMYVLASGWVYRGMHSGAFFLQGATWVRNTGWNRDAVLTSTWAWSALRFCPGFLLSQE